MLRVEQDHGVLGGQGVPALGGASRGVVAVEDPGDRLLLQPLPGIPRVESRALGELDGGHGPGGQGRVGAEPGPELDGQELDHRQARLDEAAGERADALLIEDEITVGVRQ
jgi:hypothetical protein